MSASDGGYTSDGGGNRSDGGYRSDGNLSSMYSAYSKHKRSRRSPIPRPSQSKSVRRVRAGTSGFRMSTAAIYRLPDNILFDIFTFYGEDVFSEPGGHKFWWLTLALVSQKWNAVIRSSPNHFLGELRFGSDSSDQFLMNVSHRPGDSVASLLRRWRLSSIHLHYQLNQSSPRSGEDEDNILILLQHLERICCLQISAPLSTWRSIAAASLDPPISCTGIERINFDTGNRKSGLVLPSTFLAGNSPRLRESPHSSSTASRTRRSFLQKCCLGISAICPNYNTSTLDFCPRMVGAERARRKLPLFSSITWCFPISDCSAFAVSAHVHEIHFILFHQLRYFRPNGAIISAGLAFPSSAGEKLVIVLPCHHFDFQVASVAQICSALRPNFANMEDLFIKYHQNQLPVEWHGHSGYQVHSFQK
ncbi:hypothetical protein BGW80DRAFT_1302282 [Lactifluus volemus]|nr:hypothetical protein BGW80DRAFT_1302282 [Lactifluus volemus]